ncbi:EAL domain-containing protein [Paraburkholderia bannensis]|nr:EAL domain-containing protein [Paraburkholderia bannensis]RQM44779.1 EAL domain-containing protein [Paraburkholderia bannensis]
MPFQSPRSSDAPGMLAWLAKLAARGLVIALAAGVPLVLCVLLTRYEAVRIGRSEAALASNFVVNQVMAIVEQARDAARSVAPHAGAPCETLSRELSLAAATQPYVRTLNILDSDHVACSSATGNQSIAVETFLNGNVRTPRGDWLMIVPGTPLVANRPALLVAVRAIGGRNVVAAVDSQYLLDLLHAAAPHNEFRQATLRVGTGPALHEIPAGGDPARDEAGGDSPMESAPLLADVRRTLDGSVIELRLQGLPERLNATWRVLLFRYLPWTALLAALLVWLVYRVQQSRRSRREQLLRAIRAGEFHVEYQPLFGVASGRCEGAEALLRWVRPGIGTVRPDEFIQAAEEEHVIVPLTQHLLTLIAQDVMKWATLPGFHLGINFAPEHLSSEALLPDVRNFTRSIGGRGIEVVLEITERSLVRNTDVAQRNLVALRRDGVRVAIDDFGTGFCSLSYLEKFPFDILKIDRGFVLTIDAQERSAVVLDSIIGLAHSLDAKLVAEGVASQAQFDYLCARGTNWIQGFFYAKPMPADDFGRWYRGPGMAPFPAPVVAAAREAT